MSVDALGNPLRFTLTEGQAHDITQADELIDGIESDYVIADRGYDSQRLRERIVEMGATPVISCHCNMMSICTENLVECYASTYFQPVRSEDVYTLSAPLSG